MDLVVHFNSMCEMHVHGCPVIFYGSFEKLSLTVSGNKSDPISPLKVLFEKKCIHEKDRGFGRVYGFARKLELEEVISICSVFVW